MTRRGLTAALLAGAALWTMTGCGPRPAEVSGTVLIDGKPLAEGQIIFEATDARATPVAGSIKEGKYAVKVPPGAKKVKITASRPTKKPDPVMGAAARESMIAPEFNDRTTLTADVKAGKQDGVNFEVRSIR
jgi:hypothetical protein